MKARLDEMSTARLKRMLDVNVFGTLLCSREAVKRMSTRHGGAGGTIVNLSSIAASLGAPSMYVDYAASKGAIDSFTLGLGARAGARRRARQRGAARHHRHRDPRRSGDAQRAHKSASLIPMQRPGTALEIAQAIVWLVSDESSYITGIVLGVSGGR